MSRADGSRSASRPPVSPPRPLAGPTTGRRRWTTRLAVASCVPFVLFGGLASMTTDASPGDQGATTALPAGTVNAARTPRLGPDWSPSPATFSRLRTVATADGRGLRLLTTDGARSFIAGVDVGATTPGHQPGELAIDGPTYRRWFEQMGRLGIRAVRIYTIHRPEFYQELLRYNESHPKDPIYLVQGVYLPDETYLAQGTLYDPVTDNGFAAEIADAVRAVHGTLDRGRLPGRAWGRWTADVSPWVMSWIVGVEWDPQATARTDARHAQAPRVNGRYFRSTPDATPTERWIAKHLNSLAQLEASHGRSMPIAFVNWPTTDPLRHPAEPTKEEDLVGVDANHVLPTLAWPGGTFASYHAYPYYPDFLRFEPGLLQPHSRGPLAGTVDAYAAYLGALRKHHPSMPVMITELGVPSSLGSAHVGTNGRDQGGHSEDEAMAINASLLRTVKAQGLSGAFLFSWTDEWFKFTWNTLEHQAPRDRRQLWHDPLTNEQYFGLLAHDPVRISGARTERVPNSGKIAKIVLDADPSYVFIDVTYRAGRAGAAAPGGTAGGGITAREPLIISAEVVPGGTGRAGDGGSDHRIEIDPRAGNGRALVRAALAPARLDTWEPLPQAGEPWQLYRLITNRSYAGVEDSTMEYQDVGTLVRGSWDPAEPGYSSLATWRASGDTVRMRIPWAMLGLADPSSRTARGEGTPMTTHRIEDLTLSFSVGGSVPYRTTYTWPTWNDVTYTERAKAGLARVGVAFQAVTN
ncbi:MAG: hypothetical protein JNL54_16345 [Kineosporiaceae bacterium]|nr:hypothetical protein [Kineosporiaceae bacterium]